MMVRDSIFFILELRAALTIAILNDLIQSTTAERRDGGRDSPPRKHKMEIGGTRFVSVIEGKWFKSRCGWFTEASSASRLMAQELLRSRTNAAARRER
uniref:Putative secreted protein n=1 Tax=Anopheles triannulatus TaxID=58253 RepID=A0A2M4B775_9DIPT